MLLQKLQKGNVRLDAKSRPLQRRQEAHCAEPLAERNAFRREQAAEEVERRGKPERAEGKILRVADLERQAQEGVLRHAHRAQDAPELGVGADQDVLAVIELVPLGDDAPGPAARHRSRFEDGDGDAALGERHRGGHAGIPCAYDRDGTTHVFQAIQNLRSGVKDVRWVSTRKPSLSISASSAR